MPEKKNIKDLKLNDHENIISICVIGSYNTDLWNPARSDIDILILLDKKLGIEYEFKIEDDITIELENYFEFKNIHIIFLYMNEFDNEFADCYIKSSNKLIFDFNREIDFRLYVNKYHRNNEWLEDIIKKDTELMKENENVTLL